MQSVIDKLEGKSKQPLTKGERQTLAHMLRQSKQDAMEARTPADSLADLLAKLKRFKSSIKTY